MRRGGSTGAWVIFSLSYFCSPPSPPASVCMLPAFGLVLCPQLILSGKAHTMHLNLLWILISCVILNTAKLITRSVTEVMWREHSRSSWGSFLPGQDVDPAQTELHRQSLGLEKKPATVRSMTLRSIS